MNDFNWKQYINNYDDIQRANIDTEQKALHHWNKYGKEEGRTDKKINELVKNNENINLGINLITYYGSFGLGQNGILFENILNKLSNIPFNIIKLKKNDTPDIKVLNVKKKFDFSYIYCIYLCNADESYIVNSLDLDKKYIQVGLWAWELDVFPNEYHSCKLNEIWTISDYCTNSIKLNSHVNCINIFPAVLQNIDNNLGLFAKNLSKKYNFDNNIIFLTMFDISSSISRKNPLDLLDIFKENDWVNKKLVVKYTKSNNDSDKLLESYLNCRNIIFINDELDHKDILDLYKISDVFILTSTCEGQGRSVIESLQCGTKVFCVNYSSLREYYNNNNIEYIDYEKTEIDCDRYLKMTKSIKNKIYWSKMKKDSLETNINKINEKQPFNMTFKNDIEQLLSQDKMKNIIYNRLQTLAKLYIDNIISSKLKKVINFEMTLLHNNDLAKLNEKQLSSKLLDQTKIEGRQIVYSYKTNEVKQLLNSYNIRFLNNYKYFYVNQSEPIDFEIKSFKKCILTTSNINYISRVSVLSNSIKKQHPNLPIYNIIVDDFSQNIKNLIRNDKTLNFVPVFIDELDISSLINLDFFCFQYNVTDLNTAVKPWGFKYLFKKGYQQILYFDSDILTYDKLDSLFNNLNTNSFVLTPHFTNPLPDFPNANPTDNIVNRVGQFNLGFIGISNKINGIHFVDYWCSKTKYRFNEDIYNGHFTDQVWCNLIPSFYDDYYIERSFSCNIAYWNLSHRDNTIKTINNKWHTKDGPFIFCHFSGVIINNNNILSKHQNVLDINNMNFKPLLRNYINLLKKEDNMHQQYVNSKYKFDFYNDNTIITQCDRENIIDIHSNNKFHLINKLNPFDIHNKNIFYEINNLKKGQFESYEDVDIYLNRKDLQIAFVDIKKFNNWKKKKINTIKKYTIYGERCTGTNYLENIINMNFDVNITWEYGWKHFFGFQDDKLKNSDNTLFICIVRNLPDWINSFYREMHHLPLRYKNNMSEEEKIDEFLNKEFWSFFDNNGNRDISKEIMEDRNMYTGERYKNIFELRNTKIKWMIEDLPNKVKNYIFIRYEDLENNFEKILLEIKDKGLEIKKNINFPLNTTIYKSQEDKVFQKKENSISTELILNNPYLIPFYEQKLYNI
tara:strand:+ start:5772 stop:9152 length:3381 start_codon:yes stop_codon:yes gene_type:complete